MDKLNLIFVWIPKNGGSTVYASCKSPLGIIKQKSLPNEEISTGIYTFVHQSLKQLVSKGYVSKSYVQNAYKFAVSRCPYERAVSLYCYLKNISKARLTPFFSRSPTFLEYLQTLEKRGFLPLDVGKYHWRQFSNPQSIWLNEYPLDQVIPLQNLEVSLNELCYRFTLRHSSFSIVNTNPHNEWKTFYCRDSKQLVEFLYERDFNELEHFNVFEFDVPDKRTFLLTDEYELPSRMRSRAIKFLSLASRLSHKSERD